MSVIFCFGAYMHMRTLLYVFLCVCECVCVWTSVRKFGACLFLGARLRTGTSPLDSLPHTQPHTHAFTRTCLCNGFDFVVPHPHAHAHLHAPARLVVPVPVSDAYSNLIYANGKCSKYQQGGLGAKRQCVRGNWRYVALRGELCSLSQCLHGLLWNSPAVPLEPQISHLSYGMLFTRTLAYFLIRIKEQRKLFPMPKGQLCT